MKYVGVDLHKKTISICVVVLAGRKRKVLVRRRFACQDMEGICQFFRELGTFQVVVEATANYNADVKELFTARGLAYLEEQKVSAADRFVLNHLLEEWREHCRRQKEADKPLESFANVNEPWGDGENLELCRTPRTGRPRS